MTILHPEALAWALLAVPIVLLYLWELRPRRNAVATGFLWERVFGAAEHRSPWWPLRRPASLGLQLVLLATLCIALAEPHFGTPRRLVIVIDSSASMNATDVEPTRLDRAKEIAQELVATLGDRDRLAIVSAGETVRLYCGLTGRRDKLEEALRGVAASDGPTRVTEAVALARQVLDGEPAGTVVVLSDGCFEGAEELAREDDVRWITVGGAGDNVAITGLSARRNLDHPERCQVFARLRSFSNEPVACALELEWSGKPVSTVRVELPASGKWQRVFEMTAPEGGRLTARLDRPDAVAKDDFASLLLPPARILHVTLVTGGSVYLEKALEANPRVRLTVSDAAPGRPADGTVLVLQQQVPDRLPPTPMVVLDPTGSCDLWEVGDPVEDAIVARQNEGLALLADVRLEELALRGLRRLELTDGARSAAEPVAWTEDGVAVGYAIDRPGGRVLVLSGILEGSDLPLRPAFPILISNALDWVAANGTSDGVSQGERAGDEPLAASRRLNPESDVRVPGALASLNDVRAAGPSRPSLWLFPAGVALVLLLAEWSLFQRRWTC